MKIFLFNAPGNYFGLLQEDTRKQIVTGKQLPGFIHLFAKDTALLKKEWKKFYGILLLIPLLSFGYPGIKKASGIATDLTEEVIRNFALQNNLVDIKVCAVSEQWSGLKLVVPVAKK